MVTSMMVIGLMNKLLASAPILGLMALNTKDFSIKEKWMVLVL